MQPDEKIGCTSSSQSLCGVAFNNIVDFIITFSKFKVNS